MEALNTSQENVPLEEGTANSASPAETPASPSRRLKRSASRELSSSSEKRRELSSSAGSRSLRKQSSSPGLTQEKGGDAAASSAQEPWKREVNDLWAKQLAMMREINTLKVELGRREAARQREILAMRQEVDVIKAEIFRMRTVIGGPLPSQPDKEGQEEEEGGEDSTGEQKEEMDTSVGEEKTD